MDLLSRKRPMGVGDASLNIGRFKEREFGQDVFGRVTGGQHTEHVFDGNSQSANDRFAAENRGIDRDAPKHIIVGERSKHLGHELSLSNQPDQTQESILTITQRREVVKVPLLAVLYWQALVFVLAKRVFRFQRRRRTTMLATLTSWQVSSRETGSGTAAAPLAAPLWTDAPRLLRQTT
jgi:hypothetical protein